MPPRFSDDLKTQQHHINKGFLRSSENKRSKKADCLPRAVGKQSASIIKGVTLSRLSGFSRFIRAQTISFDDFIRYQGEQGAKEAGKMRAEDKDYVVKDGDVMNFLFNV